MFNFFKKKPTQLSQITWKDSVRTWEAQQKAIQDAEKQRIQVLEKLRQDEAGKQFELELQKKIQILGQTFACHCCHKKSQTPKNVNEGYMTGMHDNTYWRDNYVTHWNQPGDLEKCKTCQQWTCADCMKDGICKNCWEVKAGLKL
jgi:hypothetical protein